MKLECVGRAKKRACDGRWARSIFLPCLFWSFFRLRKKGRRKRSRTELRLAKSFCLIKRPVHDLLLFFFVLIQKRTKKDQARTLAPLRAASRLAATHARV